MERYKAIGRDKLLASIKLCTYCLPVTIVKEYTTIDTAPVKTVRKEVKDAFGR